MTRSDKWPSGHKDWSKIGAQFVDEDGVKEYNKQKARGKLY